ncbi:DUF2807 domain-containing protein [Patiriisocius marinistellae]|uniref:DUF2807 domain-containing protein n=1 Tax=Patiriisocius marinistellae TaxID=2494560 RepID=A0A5J4FSC8_9FLAO|nr:head GIN domain-containing protein [Patiriisocius marinistellae]GEQ84887.1 DUF2807 domain-containing protein [Patiriisocius marinistellae]
MKNLFTLALVLLTTFTIAQNREETVPQFNEIKVFDLIEVELITADENKIVITGTNVDDVKVEVDDKDILKIRMKLDTRFNGNDTQVKVYHTGVTILDANEGGEITSAQTFKQENIIIRTQEGGEVRITLDVNNGEFKSVSGGSIQASGMIVSQEITVNSGGGFRGEDLKSQNTEVKVTAGGAADVYASEKVDAKVTAGGTITVYGNPKKINKKKRLGGKIIIKE